MGAPASLACMIQVQPVEAFRAQLRRQLLGSPKQCTSCDYSAASHCSKSGLHDCANMLVVPRMASQSREKLKRFRCEAAAVGRA